MLAYRLNDAGGSLVGYGCCDNPPDCFVEQVADHELPHEQEIPLDNVIEVTRQSGRSHGLWRRPLPCTTDATRVDNVLYEG